MNSSWYIGSRFFDAIVLASFGSPNSPLMKLQRAERGQTDGRARDRIDACEVEILAREQRGARAANGNTGGQRQRIATGVAVHLQRRITLHVPGEAQAWAELILDLDIGVALAVDVLEAVPAQPGAEQERVGDVPVVFDVERALLALRRSSPG